MAINKLKVVFEPQEYESVDKVVKNALLIQLMVAITRISMRVDSPEIKSNAIIRKEKEYGTE